MKKKSVWVKIPASTSNLGPGFDVLGLALDLHNELRVSVEPQLEGIEILVEGEGADSLPRDERNVAWQAMKEVLEKAGLPLAGYRISLMNRIPLARGLGSSAAARLAGILAGNALAKNAFSRERLLDLATRMEGHPDNVVPCLVGGLCISAYIENRVQYIRLDPPTGLQAVVCVPEFELATQAARAVLPREVSRHDAVFNVSRVALFLGALANKDYSFLRAAMEDRLHQNYRKNLVPGFDRVVENALQAGAFGVALSGAGPSMFAFAPKAKAKAVGRAMEKGFMSANFKSRSSVLPFNKKGSQVQWQ